MKAKFIVFSVATILAGLLSFETAAAVVISNDNPPQIPIPVIVGNPPHSGQLKTPARIPICAEYNPAFSSIIVSFLADIGEVDIEVENHSTGEVYLDMADSLNAGCVVMISGTSGFYTITFTLESGAVYYGEFEL